MPLTVHPGDRVTASVAVTGRRVRMRLHNVTTNATFTKTLKAPTVDLRSADWVLEAPSLCDDSGVCQVSQLANFGTFGFSDASATTTSGHTGLIADPAWSATAIDLVPGSGPDGGAGPNIGVADGASASTGDLSASGGAFDDRTRPHGRRDADFARWPLAAGRARQRLAAAVEPLVS
jgi:hypothetical protein